MLLPLVTLLIASVLCAAALAGKQGHQRHLDWLFVGAVIPFACLALLALFAAWSPPPGRIHAAATRAAYQFMILGVTVFMFALPKEVRPAEKALAVLQFGLGIILALAPPIRIAPHWPGPWEALNLAISGLLVTQLAYVQVRYGGLRGWIVLIAAMPAFGMMTDDLLAIQHDGAVAPSLWQTYYLLILSALWVASSRHARIRLPQLRTRAVIERERQRLARNLHDGVGSHLTTLVSTLETGASTREHTMAVQLRHCLVELQLLVDGDEDGAALPSLLGSLRYRFQPLLAAARIQLNWNIDDLPVLQRVEGDAAREILYIAQESIANVVRHARARTVTVACESRDGMLVLEIADDGIPWPTDGPVDFAHLKSSGRGLRGMHQRSRRLGGQLTIECTGDRGTRVRLRAPLLAPAAQRSADSGAPSTAAP